MLALVRTPSGATCKSILQRYSKYLGCSSITLPPVSAANFSRHGRLQVKKIRTGPSLGYPVSRNAFMSGSGESFTPRIQGSGDSSMSVQNILPTSFCCANKCPSSSDYSIGFQVSSSSAPEATTMTFLCSKSFRPVYTTASIRSTGPCQNSLRTCRIFSHLWKFIPI